jgi:hypothetical protein
MASNSFFHRTIIKQNAFSLGVHGWKLDMTHLNKNDKKNNHLLAAASIFVLAVIMVISSVAFAPIAATPSPTTTSNATAAIPSSSSSSGIELSSQPVYQEHLRVVGENPINETHTSITFSGNGTLTLPNNTQTINTTGNGSALISFETLSVQGKETIRTQDDNETASATFYEIDQQPSSTGEGKGITIAAINTNSTSGVLAPLNGMILAGTSNIQTTTGESDITLWQWETGISNSGVSISTTTEGAPSTNSTTTTTTEASPLSSSPLTPAY